MQPSLQANAINAYVITLTQVPDRLQNAQEIDSTLATLNAKSANQLFHDHEIFHAVYWKDKHAISQFFEQNPEFTIDANYLDQCHKGQLACTLSHLSVWKKALQSGTCQGALIFEDDAYITDEDKFQQVINNIKTDLPQEIDFLRIHLFIDFRAEFLAQKTDNRLWHDDDAFKWGGAAYYLSLNGIKKLLSSLQVINDNWDMIIPLLRDQGELKCAAIADIVVDHRKFQGTEIPAQRHEFELLGDRLQDLPSNIWNSPEFYKQEPLYQFLRYDFYAKKQQLHDKGLVILPDIFDAAALQQARAQILQNLSLFKNTRPNPDALHLAGFHRYPELESLHYLLAGNITILSFLKYLLDGENVRSLGMSDITINRSQCWHKDLLRSSYQTLINPELIWQNNAEIFRVVLYLQDSHKLKIVPKSHKQAIDLSDDKHAIPEHDNQVESVPVKAGSVVIMDIRTTHHDAQESDFITQQTEQQSILIATTIGKNDSEFAEQLEAGNAIRLREWAKKDHFT